MMGFQNSFTGKLGCNFAIIKDFTTPKTEW